MPMKIPKHVPLGVAATKQEQHRIDNRIRVQRHGTRAARGYNAQHRKVRAAWLQQHPLCEWCLERGVKRPATEMDHKNGDPFNISNENLRSGCKSCHSTHTNKSRHIKPGSR
jgi:5-methylcytosine-specific restriction protein A